MKNEELYISKKGYRIVKVISMTIHDWVKEQNLSIKLQSLGIEVGVNKKGYRITNEVGSKNWIPIENFDLYYRKITLHEINLVKNFSQE